MPAAFLSRPEPNWLWPGPAVVVKPGSLLLAEFYNPDSGWSSEASLAAPIVEGMQTEFSVHRDGDDFLHKRSELRYLA